MWLSIYSENIALNSASFQGKKKGKKKFFPNNTFGKIHITIPSAPFKFMKISALLSNFSFSASYKQNN